MCLLIMVWCTIVPRNVDMGRARWTLFLLSHLSVYVFSSVTRDGGQPYLLTFIQSFLPSFLQYSRGLAGRLTSESLSVHPPIHTTWYMILIPLRRIIWVCDSVILGSSIELVDRCIWIYKFTRSEIGDQWLICWLLVRSCDVCVCTIDWPT